MLYRINRLSRSTESRKFIRQTPVIFWRTGLVLLSRDGGHGAISSQSEVQDFASQGHVLRGGVLCETLPLLTPCIPQSRLSFCFAEVSHHPVTGKGHPRVYGTGRPLAGRTAGRITLPDLLRHKNTVPTGAVNSNSSMAKTRMVLGRLVY